MKPISRWACVALIVVAGTVGCGGGGTSAGSVGPLAGQYIGDIFGTGASTDYSQVNLAISNTGAISGSVQPMFGPYSGMSVGVTGTITSSGALLIKSNSPNVSLTVTGVVSFGPYSGGEWNFTGLTGSGSQSVGSSQEAVTILFPNTAYGESGA